MDGDVAMAIQAESKLPSAALARFEREFRGEVITPKHPAYQGARLVWNGMIDKRPLLIARPSDPADVATVVRLAREHGVVFAIRGGGHNVAGSAVCDGGIVCDLSALRAVHVDRVGRIARAQGAPSGQTSIVRLIRSAWRPREEWCPRPASAASPSGEVSAG